MGLWPAWPPEASLLVCCICIMRGSKGNRMKSIHLCVRLISEVGMRVCNEAILAGPCGDYFNRPLRCLSSNTLRVGLCPSAGHHWGHCSPSASVTRQTLLGQHGCK